jgi:predicted nuclease with TOPRIM domain
MPIDKQEALRQIDDVLGEWSKVQDRMDEWDDGNEVLERTVIAQMRALISHLAPPGSPHISVVRNQYGNYYDEMLDLAGALRALRADYEAGRVQSSQDVRNAEQAFRIVETICNRFHAVTQQLRHRHENRPTLDVADEHDVQDLFHALLRLHFDDIRSEEWTPSYAGRSSRMDFLLKSERIVVETKRTRKGLDARKVGEELTIDIAHYRAHQDCKMLVCFVYDPENRISNPAGLESDLSQQSDSFAVRVMICPRM